MRDTREMVTGEEARPSVTAGAAVSVDVALLTIRQGRLSILLVRRTVEPFAGLWGVPGGLLERAEGLEDVALRGVREQAGVEAHPSHLEQLRTYGDPDRDPRMRTVSVAYLALMPEVPPPVPGVDVDAARFWPVEDLWDHEGPPIAFDHERMIADAVERARSKLEYTSLATSFVDEPFTIGDLRRVYEAVWGVPLHHANFRRKVLSTTGFVIPTGEEISVGRGPMTELYRRGAGTHLHPPMLRPDGKDDQRVVARQGSS